MQECSLKKQKRNKQVYCMQSFKLIVFTISAQEECNFNEIIERFEKDDKLKMYNVCYWLSGRKMLYKVCFRYNFEKGPKWNIIRFRNYIRLKMRLKGLQKGV